MTRSDGSKLVTETVTAPDGTVTVTEKEFDPTGNLRLAPAAPVEAPAVALTPEEEKAAKVAAKAAKLAAEANKETDKMNKLTEFVSPTPSASLSSSGSQHLSLRPVIHAI